MGSLMASDWLTSDPPWTSGNHLFNATKYDNISRVTLVQLCNTTEYDNLFNTTGNTNNSVCNESSSSTNGYAPYPAYLTMLMSLACSVILVVGLIGNCLVPVVIWNNRDLRNSTNLFLLNLSLADILVLCVSMPTVLVEIHNQPEKEVWVLGQFMCKVVPFMELMLAHVSVLTILAISFERYYVITRPLRAGYTCTRVRAFFIILVVWLIGSISSSPMLFIVRYREAIVGTTEASCLTEANTFWKQFYFIGAISLFFFFPMLILILVYSVIARHLVADPCTASNHRIQVTSANTDNPNSRARRQVVVMLGTVVVFFFICLMPFRVLTLWFILTPDENLTDDPVTWFTALNFCRVMIYINSAINPILYNVMSSKFRAAFLKALGLTWNRKYLLRHLSRQSTFNTTTTSGTSSNSTSMSSGASKARVAAALVAAGRTGVSPCDRKDIVFIQKRAGSHPTIHTSNKPMMQTYGRQGSCSNTLIGTPQRLIPVAGRMVIHKQHNLPDENGSTKPLLKSTNCEFPNVIVHQQAIVHVDSHV